MGLFDRVVTESDLEDSISTPSAADIDCCGRLDGDVLVLGAAGKMGPSLVRRILRASSAAGVLRRVFAVSRFSTPESRVALTEAGATTIAADLLDPGSVAALPECRNVLFLAGRKFGATGDAPMTWAVNTIAPAYVAARFGRSESWRLDGKCLPVRAPVLPFRRKQPASAARGVRPVVSRPRARVRGTSQSSGHADASLPVELCR